MKNEVYWKEHKKTFLFFLNNYAFICNSKELMTILIFQLNQKSNDIVYKKKE